MSGKLAEHTSSVKATEECASRSDTTLGCTPSQKEQGRRCVPEVVHAEGRLELLPPAFTHPRTPPSLAHNSAEVAIVQVACIERAPELSREDEALVAVLGSDQKPLLRLSGTVRPDGERGQHHDAPAFVGLRWYELPRLVLRRSPAHEASLHVDATLIKVEVRPGVGPARWTVLD